MAVQAPHGQLRGHAQVTGPGKNGKRGRLLYATIDSLAATGYSGFSTNDVAGVRNLLKRALAAAVPETLT